MSISTTTYLASKQRVDSLKGDVRDEVIVAMWELNTALCNELTALRAAHTKLTESLSFVPSAPLPVGAGLSMH